MTTTLAGRSYDLIELCVGDMLKSDLRSRGFDGTVWVGTSTPTGRQRVTKTALLYRAARTAEFVCIGDTSLLTR